MEQWETPDGDVVEYHRLAAPNGAGAHAPQLLLLHGLEGSARSHYAVGTLEEAHRRGWHAGVLVFRSCGTEPNRLERFYHSGDTGDLDLAVERLTAERPAAPLVLAGISLGGNVLLKWLGERGERPPVQLCGAAAVSVPYDLERAARHIGRGFARLYEAHFLRSLRRKALAKRERFPHLPNDRAIRAARTLYAFDDVVTAPLHGFRDAADYYARSSALQYLAGIRVPTLLLSAEDDPFLPRAVLGEARAAARENPALTVEFLPHGGHAGFVGGRVPWRAGYYAERRVPEFLAGTIAPGHPRSRGRTRVVSAPVLR